MYLELENFESNINKGIVLILQYYNMLSMKYLSFNIQLQILSESYLIALFGTFSSEFFFL